MAYSEKLVDRLRIALMDIPHVGEKKLFSGVAFMVNDKMCINVTSGGLMCRIDPELHDELLEKRACRTMVMKGKELKGYLLINEEGVGRKAELEFWVRQCLDFNARAKSSKKAAAKPSKKPASRSSKKK